MVNPGPKIIYKRLFNFFGPQHWWPASSRFEVMLGAILTQNTNWKNVAKAIDNLKKERLISPDKLDKLSKSSLAELIRPAGYYNIKAKRIKNFLRFLFLNYGFDIKKMRKESLGVLRPRLLDVNGIGQETADSILLYALDKPVFVVDAYTKRIFSRHKFTDKDCEYQELQQFFMKNLENDVKLFNEYHALIVRLAKEYCLKNAPKCKHCPLCKYDQ